MIHVGDESLPAIKQRTATCGIPSSPPASIADRRVRRVGQIPRMFNSTTVWRAQRPRAFGPAGGAIPTVYRPTRKMRLSSRRHAVGDSEEEPSLDKLADAVGLSPSYFHRMFKAATGVTPKDYAAAYRAAKVREGLASGSSVTEAIYDAGFNSSGRFYEKSADMLGMTPSQYRAGGA